MRYDHQTSHERRRVCVKAIDSIQNLLLSLSLRAKNNQILQPLESLARFVCYCNVAKMGDYLANSDAVVGSAHFVVGVGEGQLIVVNASQQSEGCTGLFCTLSCTGPLGE